MGQGTSQHLTTVKDALSPNVTCWDVPCPISYALVKRPTDVITRPMISQVCCCPDSGGRDARLQLEGCNSKLLARQASDQYRQRLAGGRQHKLAAIPIQFEAPRLR